MPKGKNKTPLAAKQDFDWLEGHGFKPVRSKNTGRVRMKNREWTVHWARVGDKHTYILRQEGAEFWRSADITEIAETWQRAANAETDGKCPIPDT